MANVNCVGKSTEFVYGPRQAPAEHIPNDLLKNTLKPMLGWSDYGSLARVNRVFHKKVQPILDDKWNRILKAITFGRDKWLNIPGIVTVSEEPLFTNEQAKSITAKLKGTCQVFNEFDPIRPHRFQNDKVKKMWETHMLIFFPESINNDPRTLNSIGRLFRFEREGDHPTVFVCIPGDGADTFRNQYPTKSYWRLVPRDVFPGSQWTKHARNMEIVKSMGRIVPTPCDAATAILIMNFDHLLENGDYFFGRRGGNATFMATDSENDGSGVIGVVGAADSSGLRAYCSPSEASGFSGITGFLEVL